MPSQTPEAPNPPLAPPLVYILFFLAAFFLNLALPLQFLPLGWNRIPALLLCLGGLGIFLSAALALRKAKTPVSPYQPAKTLLTTGPYLRSRNPIYLAFAWIYLGFACWIASWWPVFLFPVLIYVMNRFVIRREEAHLESRFGRAYAEYKARTRRWM
ncbi:MAG: isoprenylcysteine carboxyl methyltransferase [Fibrobacteria bacterium]|jgi:protein-S-isoprenylcysteine O-methyltransferase Ste14|nr:isoprenylcysteine carboxyl methyltransferase [Fibrobacteria bacterium]